MRLQLLDKKIKNTVKAWSWFLAGLWHLVTSCSPRVKWPVNYIARKKYFQIEKDFAYLKQLCSDTGSYTKLEEDIYDMEKIKAQIEKDEDKGTLF